MSNGVAPNSRALAVTWFTGTKMNSASRSTNFLMSHGQATRSTFTFSRIIHFMAFPCSVFEVRIVLEADRIGRFARLLQNVWFGGRAIIPVHAPFRRAATSLRRRPVGRNFASDDRIEVNGLGSA